MRSLLLFVIFVAAALTVTRGPVRIQPDMPPAAYRTADTIPTSRHLPSILKRTRHPEDEDEVIWRGAVDGPARTTREKAHADAVTRAAVELKNSLGLEQDVPPLLVEKIISGEREKTVDLGAPNGTAQSISLDLALTAGQAKVLSRNDQNYRVNDRLAWMSRLLAVLVAGLFAVTGYVRLDEWSKGYYTRTLKVVALVGFAAAAFTVWKSIH